MVVGDTKGMNGSGVAGDEEGLEFETTRIEVLKEERSQIQKKTFTKWVNSNLKKKKVCLNQSTPRCKIVNTFIAHVNEQFILISHTFCSNCTHNFPTIKFRLNRIDRVVRK